jgi:penicillin-binding protein 1A
VEAAQRVGISSPLEQNASLALGTSEVTPIEMVSAYGAFANGGLRVHPYLVTQIDDMGGHVLYQRTAPAPERVIADHVDKDMVAMLAGVVTSGTGRGAAIPGHETAGKTGTTQDYHDAWFVGFTHDYVAAVWVGNDDASPMRNVTGGTIPAEIWREAMTAAERNLPNTPLEKSTPQSSDMYAESGTMYGDTEQGVSIDASNGGVSEDETKPPPPTPSDDSNAPGERRSFFDWLFGRSQRPQPAVPAAAPPRQSYVQQPPRAVNTTPPMSAPPAAITTAPPPPPPGAPPPPPPDSDRYAPVPDRYAPAPDRYAPGPDRYAPPPDDGRYAPDEPDEPDDGGPGDNR